MWKPCGGQAAFAEKLLGSGRTGTLYRAGPSKVFVTLVDTCGIRTPPSPCKGEVLPLHYMAHRHLRHGEVTGDLYVATTAVLPINGNYVCFPIHTRTTRVYVHSPVGPPLGIEPDSSGIRKTYHMR